MIIFTLGSNEYGYFQITLFHIFKMVDRLRVFGVLSGSRGIVCIINDCSDRRGKMEVGRSMPALFQITWRRTILTVACQVSFLNVKNVYPDPQVFPE